MKYDTTGHNRRQKVKRRAGEKSKKIKKTIIPYNLFGDPLLNRDKNHDPPIGRRKK